jgi:peptidoglycan L-alanyl-D-glutamate endopeptidase CwlK
MTNTAYRLSFFEKFCHFYLQASNGGILLLPYWFNRTAPQQFELYQQGRTTPGRIITNCDGYKKISPHQRWRAIDAVIVNPDGTLNWDASAKYEVLGEMWKNLGGKAGKDFKSLKDYTHFEL